MRISVKIIAVVAVVVAIALIGSAVILSQPANGQLSISVKDAAGDWKNVNATFSEVRVHRTSAGNDSGWVSLSIVNGQVDLASLTNVSELLASSSIAAGNYTQIRIIVSSVTGTMINGTTVNFTVPSGELIINHPFNVTSGAEQKLTIDIDLEHSIVQNGSKWTFKPVLGGVTEG